MKVIAGKNLPMKPPIVWSIVLWLLLDRLDTPDFVWGMCGMIAILVWIAWIVYALHREEVDLFTATQKDEKKAREH